MTTLADLLDGPPATRVHRVEPAVTPATIERAALDAGWRFALVESSTDVDKTAVLGSFRDGLGLPDWFGMNLDALVDALRDLGGSADDGAGTVLVWDRPDRFRTDHPADYRAVREVLAHRSADPDRARLVVLVRPEPPAASAPDDA